MSKTFPQYPATSFPDTFQSLKKYQDVTQDDLNAYNEYRNYIDNNDFNNAKTALKKITEYDSKTITAAEINTLIDTVQALQSYMDSNTWTEIVGNKQQEWQDIINQFSYIGTWSRSVQYKKWNMISYAETGGLAGIDTTLYLYIATQDNINSNPYNDYTTTQNNWLRLTLKGAQGASGFNGGFRFNWETDVTYGQGDIVVYGNSWYISLVESNTGNTPSTSSRSWEILFEVTPKQYPVQAEQPTNQSESDLWFQIVE